MLKSAMVQLNNAIVALQKEKVGVRFAYAMAKNVAKMKDEITALAAAEGASRGEYEKQRVALCRQYCDKDGNGKPVMVDGKFSGLSECPEFHVAVAKLMETFNPKIADFDKMMSEEIALDLHKVALTDFPEQLTGEQMAALLPVVDDKPNEAANGK